MWFSAKCSERNSLHDLSQCLNTAVKYFLFLPLASELLENNITFNVPWSIKNATVILWTHRHSGDFILCPMLCIALQL